MEKIPCIKYNNKMSKINPRDYEVEDSKPRVKKEKMNNKKVKKMK